MVIGCLWCHICSWFQCRAGAGDGQAQGKLASVAGKCHAAADYVNELNKKSPGIIQFRPKTGKGAWWCAVTDREGTLLAIRSSDTNEDGCDKTEFKSDAARLSELIAIAKAWTTSFSNSEAPVDGKTVWACVQDR